MTPLLVPLVLLVFLYLLLNKKVKLLVTRDHRSKRLDDVLAGWLPEPLGRPVSKAKVRKLIMAGAVYLNGTPVRNAAKVVFPGIAIEAHIDSTKLFGDSPSRDTKFEVTPAHILYEDQNLIVIDKPAGLPSQQTVDQGRDSAFAALRRFLKRRDGIDNPYVGVHHRLDRDTSGILLFTKTRQVNGAVAELFAQHQAIKTYQALTVPKRNIEKQWTIKNYVGKVSTKSGRTQYGAVRPGGSLAETSFRVIEKHPHGIWIEAIPKTGRTHQIRVHLSESGLPILGDDLYGADNKETHGSAPRLMLHATAMIFPHPVTKHLVRIESPLPRDFKTCLKQIRVP